MEINFLTLLKEKKRKQEKEKKRKEKKRYLSAIDLDRERRKLFKYL